MLYDRLYLGIESTFVFFVSLVADSLHACYDLLLMIYRGVICCCGYAMAISILTVDLKAGGRGLNAIVVVNQNSSNSCALGNYFCERRSVPAANVLRITWSGTNTLWTDQEFTATLLNPLLQMISTRGLSNQISHVVLSMDIPFQVLYEATNHNGTTSALFYGLKQDLGTDSGTTNSYAGSEEFFAQSKPASATGSSFLATMITGKSLAEAMKIVDQGVAADGANPIARTILAKSSDPLRNIRSPLFDNSIFESRILGASSIQRTNSDNPTGLSGLLGYETGLARFNISLNAFVPGAIADSLTSFGGVIFGPNDQTNLLAFVEAGATGSYGTVAEPLADSQKFPDPMVYFYQARGFGLAESYYQSIRLPYLGLIVAEPLAAPFAQPGYGSWNTTATNSVLAGNTPLTVKFTEHDSSRPLQQVDLFLDGQYQSTLTNLTPTANNSLNLSFNGYPISYSVPANATIGTIATDLTTLINDPAVSGITQIRATTHGDRIELQSTATNQLSFPFYAPMPLTTASNGITYRVTYLPQSYQPRLIPVGGTGRGDFHIQVEIP